MYSQSINFGKEVFFALPSKALYWKKLETLIVADLHLGKSISFAKNKQFLPPYDTKETLEKLYKTLDEVKPKKLIIVGDLIHDFDSILSLQKNDYKNLKGYIEKIKFIWVKGNHDNDTNIEGFEKYSNYKIYNFMFSHQPVISPLYQICGHYHPKVNIIHRGKSIFKAAFVHNRKILILPSFGAYTGGLDARSKVLEKILGEEICSYPIGKNKVYKI
tara:strand:- start:41 stop:691 length:651 start_codon:yes stop_codon:yes gene_type:complete